MSKAAAGPTDQQWPAEYSMLAFLAEIKPFLSVVEFRFGRTSWLEAARVLGANEIRGYEGLEMPAEKNKFDLALCLDGSRHADGNSAVDLIRTLCEASNWVLFAADIPGRSGTTLAHERWIESWAKLFSANGYACYDILRRRFWHDRGVAVHYRQSACLYVRMGAHYALKARGHQPSQCPPSLIHPETFARLAGDIGGHHDIDGQVQEFYRLAGKSCGGRFPGP